MTETVVTAPGGVKLRTRLDGPASGPALLLLNSLGTDLTL